jgi:hypothetical protein
MDKKIDRFELLETIVDDLIVDIVRMLERKTSGVFYLPEEKDEETMTYSYKGVNDLTLEFEVIQDPTIPEPEVDGEYVNNDAIIVLQVVYNPNEPFDEVMEIILPEVHEVLTHEIVHFLQEESGYQFPKKEPKKSLKYYTQKHEIEAQLKGFEKKSKVTKKEISDVMKDWFKKYPHKHNLTKNEVNKLIKKLLSVYGG